MTRGKERGSTRIPSLGTEFSIRATNNNIINGKYRYINPEDTIGFDLIEIFIRNNFSVLNPFKRNQDNEIYATDESFKRLEQYTPLATQIRILIDSGIEFYRKDEIGADTHNWIIKLCVPVLKSRCKIELDTLYLTSVSWKDIKAADEVSTKINEHFINIRGTVAATYRYGYHPHINTSGQPCLGEYNSRLNDYAVHGSIVGYFSTLKQWANTSNSRDAFWNLPALVREVTGAPYKVKKKRGDGHMFRKINHLLSVSLLLRMRDVFREPFEGSSYFRMIREDHGRRRIDLNVFREIQKYYITKYNRNPNKFKYNEEEVLNRTRAYSILYTLIRKYLDESISNQTNINRIAHNLKFNYAPPSRDGFSGAFKTILIENLQQDNPMYNRINECIESLADMCRVYKSHSANKIRQEKSNNSLLIPLIAGDIESDKHFVKVFNSTMEHGWYKYKNISKYFTNRLKEYFDYYFALDHLKIPDLNAYKVLHYYDLFEVKDWFKEGEITAFYKRLMAYKPAGKTRFLKKTLTETLPSIHTYVEYEDILINKHWEIEPRLGFNLMNQWAYRNSNSNEEEIKENKIRSLKYQFDVEEVFKDFNEKNPRTNNCYKIYEQTDITKFERHMKVIMIDMLYEWTANMIKTHAKEVDNAIEKRREIHENLKKEIKKVQANKYPVIKLHKTRKNKEEERTSDSTEDVSENPVFAHPV